MILTAPPPVADPVRRDIDDAVIKDARRRARRRRLSYGGVVAVVLATIAALMAWDAGPPVQGPPSGGDGGGGAGAIAAGGAGRDPHDPTVLRKGFVGLPPEGAVPSSPPTGVLELAVMTRSKRVWVYADGRMISFQNGFGGFPEAANREFSGYLEQHLTPEGVDLLRSYLTDNATTFNTPHLRIERDFFSALIPLVKVDDRLAAATVPGCGWWEEGCPRITAPETWLPASAWADQQYRAYVPTEFMICYESEQVTAAQVRATMPADAARLLSHGTDSTSGSSWARGHRECAVVSTADARTIDRAFREDDQQPEVTDPSLLRYVFNVPSNPEQPDAMKASVDFQPMLPDGYATCTRCA